jgi:hypothetical protein
MIYAKGLPLCLRVQDLVQHILVTENLMKFGMGQSMSYHIIECLVVLPTCSSTKNKNAKLVFVGYNIIGKGYRV